MRGLIWVVAVCVGGFWARGGSGQFDGSVQHGRRSDGLGRGRLAVRNGATFILGPSTPRHRTGCAGRLAVFTKGYDPSPSTQATGRATPEPIPGVPPVPLPDKPPQPPPPEPPPPGYASPSDNL